jgi:hypothetical protein
VGEQVSPWIGPAALFVAVAFAALVIRRNYKRAEKGGEKMKPMASDDRLRISLALRHLEDADRELAKAAWIDGQPGHPAVGELLFDLRDLQARARQSLRNR